MSAQYYTTGIAYGIWFYIRDFPYSNEGYPLTVPETLVTVFVNSGIAQQSLTTADTEHDLFTSNGIITFANEVNKHISDDLNLRLRFRGDINGAGNTLRYLTLADPFTERVLTGSDVRTISGKMEPLEKFVDVFIKASAILEDLGIPHAEPGYFLWSEIVHDQDDATCEED